MMKVETDLLGTGLRDQILNMLELLLNNAPNKPSEPIFFSSGKSNGKSIIDAINRYQPPVQTAKISENEWNKLQTNISLQEANSSFEKFSKLKLDKKYIYLNGGVHAKLDNREQEIIAAVGAFNKKRMDPKEGQEFEKKYAEVHFAHDIIIQLNAIANHKNYLIPELLANTSMPEQDKFNKICAYREEVAKASLKICTLLKDTKLPIDKKLKEQLISQVESDLKNAEKELSNIIPHSKQVSFLKNELNNIYIMKKELDNKLKQPPLQIADIADYIARLNESSDKLNRTSSVLSMNIDKSEKTTKNEYNNLSDAVKDLKKEINDINLKFIKNAMTIAEQHPQNPEKELFKLLNTFIKNHNDKGVEQLLKHKQIMKVIKEPKYPDHITIVMMENFANHPDTRQLYLHLEKYKPAPQQSMTKVLSNLTTPTSIPTPVTQTLPSQMITSQPTTQTTSVAQTGTILAKAEQGRAEQEAQKVLRKPQVFSPNENGQSSISPKKP